MREKHERHRKNLSQLLKQVRSDDSGNLSYYIVFVMMAIMIVIVAAVLVPLGLNFTVSMYNGGEGIIDDTEIIANEIDNEDVRNSLLSNIGNMQNSTTTQIDLLSFIWQYSWLIVLLFSLLVLVMLARRNVEKGLR